MVGSAAISASRSYLTAWSTTHQAAKLKGGASRQRKGSSAGRKSGGRSLTRASAGPVAQLKDAVQDTIGQVTSSNSIAASGTGSKAGQAASQLKEKGAEAAAQAQSSATPQGNPPPAPPNGTPPPVAQSSAAHTGSGLDSFKEKSADGAKAAVKGFEDALLPPKPPEPPKPPGPQPTSAVSSGADSHTTNAGPTVSENSAEALQKHNDAVASAPRPLPQADVSAAASPAEPSSAVHAADAASQGAADASSRIGGVVSQAQGSGSSRLVDAAAESSSAADASRPGVNAASDALTQAKSSLTAASDAAANSRDSAAQSLTNAPQPAGSSLQDSTQAATNDAVHGAQDALSGAVHAAQDALQGIQDALAQVTSSANQASGGVLQEAQNTLSQVTSSANEVSGGTLRQAQAAAQEAATASQAALAGAAAQASAGTNSALSALPPELRQAVAAAEGPLRSLFSQIASDGRAASVAGVAASIPLFLIWRARRGGFSGYLSPDAALELLNKRNATLIDLRSDEQREREGIPELRFGARGKGASISVPLLQRSLLSKVRNAGDLPYLVAALEIQGLKQVSQGSQIVILETRRKVDLRLARALKSQGQSRSYILQGGFTAWQAAGLPVRGVSEYGTTALDAITDEAEVIATNVKRTARYLSDPINLVITGGLAVGAVNTVRDWHNTLQVLGVFAPLLSTSLWYQGFDGPQEAVQSAQQKVTGFTAFVSRLIPKLPESRPRAAPQPATETSSTETRPSRQLTTPFTEALPDLPALGSLSEASAEPVGSSTAQGETPSSATEEAEAKPAGPTSQKQAERQTEASTSQPQKAENEPARAPPTPASDLKDPEPASSVSPSKPENGKAAASAAPSEPAESKAAASATPQPAADVPPATQATGAPPRAKFSPQAQASDRQASTAAAEQSLEGSVKSDTPVGAQRSDTPAGAQRSESPTRNGGATGQQKPSSKPSAKREKARNKGF